MRRLLYLVLSGLLIAGVPVAAGAEEPAADPPAAGSIEPACADATEGRFPDVSGTHAPGVECIGWWGVTQGTATGAYDPSAPVRRDQMATFIARTLELSGGDLPDSPAATFPDTDGTHQRAIDQLAALGVVGGLPDGTYRPSDTLDRAQMAAFLARAWEARTGAPLPEGPNTFTDVSGNTHETSINQVAAAGLTGGVTPTTYDPGAAISRAQMGTFLARFLGKLVADGHTTYPPSDPVALPDRPGDPDPDGSAAPTLSEASAIAQEFAAALNRGDTDAALAFLSDEAAADTEIGFFVETAPHGFEECLVVGNGAVSCNFTAATFLMSIVFELDSDRIALVSGSADTGPSF